jgi:hypothetical protein
MSHATLSASLDDKVASKLRGLASREDRSMSSLIAGAIALYTSMPRELRESLRLFAAEDPDFLRDVLNEMTALAIERKFDLARRELAKTTKPIPELADATEAEIADLAVAMTTKP